jgi:hypothetical protein
VVLLHHVCQWACAGAVKHAQAVQSAVSHLYPTCDRKKVARFVSCDLWNDKHALVSKAIAMFLQKA